MPLQLVSDSPALRDWPGWSVALQTQLLPLHCLPEVQVPHDPPQPSGPHSLPLHWGAHAHTPLEQVCVPEQLPQEPPQPSGPQFFPEH